MRILIAGQTYFPANGQAVFTVNLAEGLARAGHYVMMVMPSERLSSYSMERNGVRIEAISAIPLHFWHPDAYFTPLPGFEVKQLFDEFQPDLVHVQDHYPLSRSVLRVARRRNLPTIGTNHFLPENVTHYLPMPSWGQVDLHRLMWRAMLRMFNRLDVATAPSETAARILREQGLQVPVYAISCGVNLEKFYPDPEVDRQAMRSRYGIDPERVAFLFVGRVDQEKRLDVLLYALARLQREDMQLVIGGRGEESEALRALARRLGLGRQVVFTGYVPADDLRPLLNSVDVFAMPSEAELLSIASLEAMACARPVLAANARALPELVEHGVNGYLFQPGDSNDAARWMAQLADAPEQIKRMGAASLVRARFHSLPNTCRRYEEVYQTLVRNRMPQRLLAPRYGRQDVHAGTYSIPEKRG